jgi:hypothetical protein
MNQGNVNVGVSRIGASVWELGIGGHRRIQIDAKGWYSQVIKQGLGIKLIFSYIAQVGFFETKSFSIKTQIDGTNVVG